MSWSWFQISEIDIASTEHLLHLIPFCKSVPISFQFPLCGDLWILTEGSKTIGSQIFSTQIFLSLSSSAPLSIDSYAIAADSIHCPMFQFYALFDWFDFSSTQFLFLARLFMCMYQYISWFPTDYNPDSIFDHVIKNISLNKIENAVLNNLHKIGQKRWYKMPTICDKYLAFSKFVEILAVTTKRTLLFGDLWFCTERWLEPSLTWFAVRLNCEGLLIRFIASFNWLLKLTTNMNEKQLRMFGKCHMFQYF